MTTIYLLMILKLKCWSYIERYLCFLKYTPLFLENRQRGRFAGFSLYLSITGYIPGSTLCYKDGPRLPSLKVTITCKEHGRYLFFYNERLKGMIYPSGYELENVFTELCDVIVQGTQFNIVVHFEKWKLWHCLTFRCKIIYTK